MAVLTAAARTKVRRRQGLREKAAAFASIRAALADPRLGAKRSRSEERRVGTECGIGCRCRWAPLH